MKTKFFKFVIPAFAIVLAVVVSAFTTGEKPEFSEDNLMIGYVYESQSNPCDEIVINCSVEGEATCKYDDNTVFKELNGSLCNKPLKRD